MGNGLSQSPWAHRYSRVMEPSQAGAGTGLPWLAGLEEDTPGLGFKVCICQVGETRICSAGK